MHRSAPQILTVVMLLFKLKIPVTALIVSGIMIQDLVKIGQMVVIEQLSRLKGMVSKK